MTADKHWQLTSEDNPARGQLPALSEPVSKGKGSVLAVRLYQSDHEYLQQLGVNKSDFAREAIRSALNEIRNAEK